MCKSIVNAWYRRLELNRNMSWGYWFHEGHLSGNLSVIKFGQPVVVSCCGQAVVHFSARIEWHAGAVIAWHRARRDGSLPADLSLVRCPTMPVVNLPEFRAIEGFGGFWISCIACNETFCYWHVLQYIYIYILCWCIASLPSCIIQLSQLKKQIDSNMWLSTITTTSHPGLAVCPLPTNYHGVGLESIIDAADQGT